MSSAVWGSWAPFKRDADAARLRSLCQPHVLAVETNAHSNWINDIMFTHDDTELLRYAPSTARAHLLNAMKFFFLPSSDFFSTCILVHLMMER